MSRPATSDANPVRYDGIADWYDAQLGDAPHRDHVLRSHVGSGEGLCLDIGCGTGRSLPLLADLGWAPVGLELSADQLRLARNRASTLVQGTAERLPFADVTFPMVIASWISTDVEDFGRVLAEASRVLQPGGRFLFYGVHPCFNGPHVENREDRSRVIHPTYREARRHVAAPWWGADGIRTKAGGMRHVPLAPFLNAFVDAGLLIAHVDEPDDEPVPFAIVVASNKPEA